ncbi:MAG: hypothetical protein U5N58_09375 [Actinomycetota bacterium]|nr:hypothetical protein [Actinomycetota bacterium]
MVHQGETFIVKDFNLDRQVIEVERSPVDYYTQPLKNTDIRIEETLKHPDNDTMTFYGRIMVKENYYAYKS